MKCSNLKNDLYNMHIIRDSKCACGHTREDAEHYFLHCPLYSRQRRMLLDSLNNLHVPLDLDIILNSSKDIPENANLILLNSVFNFIIDSGRFK